MGERAMWKRRVLKKKARAAMKQSYWRMISVCFLIAMLTASYAVSTTFFNLRLSPGPYYSDASYTTGIPNSEVLKDIVDRFLENTPLISLFRGPIARVSSLVIDFYSTGVSVFFAILRSINIFSAEHPWSAIIFPLIGILLAFLYLIFVNNILVIGEKRFFLENRNYHKTAVSKIFFLYKLRCVIHPAWVMFCRTLFQLLWNLTVIGGIIKHYEYRMIPFILAENPKLSRKDAFFLSRQLMRRNKRKLFFLDVSFLGWEILSLLTLGLADFIFTNPYRMASQAELYLTLRRNYVLSRSQRYELLNDSYLEHVLSEDELLISKALYDDSQGPYTKISYFAPEQYPVFLFSVQPPVKAVKAQVKTDRKYDIFSCVFLFHAFSIFGWILETLIHLMRSGSPEISALLPGPWIPLYGIYGLLILFLAKRFCQNPVLVFLLNFGVYTALEYSVNFVSELVYGSPLRDYSEFFLNLNGRIYLGGSVSFALLGCAFLYYLAPRWTETYMKLGRSRRILVSVILSLLFLADICVSIFFVDFL